MDSLLLKTKDIYIYLAGGELLSFSRHSSWKSNSLRPSAPEKESELFYFLSLLKSCNT